MKVLFILAVLVGFTYIAVTSVLQAIKNFDEDVGL
jgi:hypothetical protein